MTAQEQKAIIDKILANHTDQAIVSTELATLTEDYVETLANLETATKRAEQLTNDNEALRQANMNLFLKIGTQEPSKDTQTQPENTTPKFENLFDKDGNLL